VLTLETYLLLETDRRRQRQIEFSLKRNRL